jgi:potassium/sodium efflux P-type ATPase
VNKAQTPIAASAPGAGAEVTPAADPSTTDAAAVAASLGTDPQSGLTSAEAATRLSRDGPNELRAAPRRSVWRRAAAQLQDPLVGLLLVAAVVALLAWWVEGRHGWPMDAIVITVVVLLNGLIGWLQENKAASAVAALARMTAATSSTLRDGRVQQVPSSQLVRGDVLVLAEGDTVGADARLLQASALHLLEASLTGESEAVLKGAATLAAPAALGDRLNMVFKGTAVAQGSGRALVTATGMQSEVGTIATLLDATADTSTPLQQEVTRLGRGLAAAAVVIAVAVVGTILITSQVTALPELVRVLLLGVSLAVAVVPEGLPAILSVVLALGVQRMARRKAIVKKLASVETLGSASVVATDKTGTLTRAEMTVVRVLTASGASDITGVGYAPDGKVEQNGAALPEGPLREEIAAVLAGGSLAGNAQLHEASPGTWQIHGDPTEAAFLVAERKLGIAELRQRRYVRQVEIPFTSARMMMSTIEADQDQHGAPMLFTKGAPGAVLARCTRARVGSTTVELDAALRGRFLADVGALADAALRTLSVAYRSLEANEDQNAGTALEHDLVYAGTVGIIDPPRAEAAVAIAQAHQAGIRVIMITGDHPRTALRIAADLGLVKAGAPVLTGLQLDAMDDVAFAAAVHHTSVFARVAPKDKLRIVHALQVGGDVVAMTGDGVNDAPALKAANIGVAMGQTGTEVTKEAARMILADDNFATIVEAVREGRGVLDNIRKFLRYLLSSNLGEVLTVFGGVVGAGLIGLDLAGAAAGGTAVLPLLATQILWINLITDAGPALAMGVDPIADDVMARPPRRLGEPMIDRHMWAGVLGTGLVMAIVTLLTIDMFLPGGLIAGSHDLASARTAGFTVLVLAQLFNCFNARSETASAWHGLFANPWLWGAVALSAVLQVAVVHVPLLNNAFGTVPLDATQWLACIGMASLALWLGEVRKMVHRAWLRRGRNIEATQSTAST